MTDNRARAPHNGKEINLAQLDAELGGHGLCSDDTNIVAIEGSPVTADQLADAIAAHVASYLEREARDAAIAHAKSLGFTDEMIAVMYPGLTV